MKIIVIGSGMYVTGRNGTGNGTILSSLIQNSKKLNIEEIIVASKSEKSENDVITSAKRIQKILNINIKVTFNPLSNYPEQVLSELHKINQFDACIISVPDHLHYYYGKICLALAIPTLMVKPLTPTLLEGIELTNIAQEKEVLACVEFHKRYDETNLWIKKAIQENKLGKINYFVVDYSQRIDIPMKTFKSWSNQSNIFQYLGVHYVDLIYFLTRFLPKRVTAYGVNGILKESGINTYDSVHVMIEWVHPEYRDNSFISNFNTNWVDPSNTSALSDQKYKVIGTLGRIECDQKNRGLEFVSEEIGIQQVNPYFSDYLPDENGNLQFTGYGNKSIYIFLNDILDLKKGKTTLYHLNIYRPSFKDSLVSVAVIEAVNKSMSENSQWIDVKL